MASTSFYLSQARVVPLIYPENWVWFHSNKNPLFQMKKLQVERDISIQTREAFSLAEMSIIKKKNFYQY
jgi:hypothetical protein